MTTRKKDLKILILGAGMSGILAGIKLKAAGMHDFEIIEKADDVGGTWQANTYPGLACDVPAHNYDYSFEHNWQWSGLYARGPELYAYFKYCVEKYGLWPHIRLRKRVAMIERQSDQWVVTTADGETRQCDIVINCMGILCHPKMPDIEGLQTFAGASFHSARWDHSVPLDGKRIGVIGTGSTAAQITAALAERSGHFSLFQRTAQWVAPALQYQRSGLMKTLHRMFPWLSRLTGLLQGRTLEQLGKGVTGDSPATLRFIEKVCHRQLRNIADPVLREKLTPDFKVGCRRMIFSDHFYKGIQAPQAELVTEGIERIEEHGVRTRDGRLHVLDVLVLATGFHALNYTYDFEVVNAAGQKLSQQWQQGAQALRGVAVDGFPNYFMLIGPKSPVGNFGLTGIAESQMAYLMSLIELLRSGTHREISPSTLALENYEQYLDAGMGKTVWSTGCRSWYQDERGKPQMYPYTPNTYRAEMRRPDLSEYVLR